MAALETLFIGLFIAITAASSTAGGFFPSNDPAIQYIGRSIASNITNPNTQQRQEGRVFDWSGVSVDVHISGTSRLSVFMARNQNYYQEVAFHAVIDGQVYSKFYVSVYRASTEYVIATNLSSGPHTVSIVRLNEPYFGSTVFYGFGLSSGGTLQAPARPNRRIQFIGDSMTCGYGNLGLAGCTGNSAQTEDAYQSHGAVTARLLKADYHVIAWSGLGMVRNYGDANPTSSAPFPSVYNRTLGYTTYGIPVWSAATWVPHAIFINLGTNDFSKGVPPSAQVYINGYINFVNMLKSQYHPSTPKFFFACGVMSNAYCAHIVNVSAAVPGSVVVNLYTLKVNATSRGCDGHPSVITDANMAYKQADVISSAMGWSV